MPVFNKVAREHVIDNLRSRADGETVVDMAKEFCDATLQSVSVILAQVAIAFGTDFTEDRQYVQSLAGEIDDFVTFYAAGQETTSNLLE